MIIFSKRTIIENETQCETFLNHVLNRKNGERAILTKRKYNSFSAILVLFIAIAIGLAGMLYLHENNEDFRESVQGSNRGDETERIITDDSEETKEDDNNSEEHDDEVKNIFEDSFDFPS